MVNCYPCKETTGRNVKMNIETEVDDETGETLMYYVCPECGDVID